MIKIRELKEKRAKLVAEARELNDKISGENRGYSDEETQTYNKIMNKANDLTDSIQREQELRAHERKIADVESRAVDAEKAVNKGKDVSVEERQMIGFNNFLRGNFAGEGIAEFRDLQADSSTQAGFWLAPQTVVNQLIKFVDDDVYMRQLGTVYKAGNAESLGAVSLDNDIDDAEWTTELETGTPDNNMSVGKRELAPKELVKQIKVSRKLLKRSNAADFVIQRLGYKFGITQEKAFMTGTGSGQPLGVFTASSDGISTSRDISADNTTTGVTFDGLKNAFYALKPQYQRRANFLFHRDIMLHISKLKDGENNYLWQPSVREGDPDTIIKRPVFQSEYAPNTQTAGQYVGMVADFSNYWIVDGEELEVQRLNELHAESNKVGFIGRGAHDAMPVLEEAFSRITLAAS